MSFSGLVGSQAVGFANVFVLHQISNTVPKKTDLMIDCTFSIAPLLGKANKKKKKVFEQVFILFAVVKEKVTILKLLFKVKQNF